MQRWLKCRENLGVNVLAPPAGGPIAHMNCNKEHAFNIRPPLNVDLTNDLFVRTPTVGFISEKYIFKAAKVKLTRCNIS